MRAFASYPTKDKAFAIDTMVWDLVALGYHDAHRSIEDGIFAINCSKYPANSIERELANRPLFINKEAANHWLRIKAPSSAQERRIAEAVLKQHKEHHGERPMRKADFVSAALQSHPGLIAHRAQQLWRDHAPEEWKKAGTKKHA